MKLNIVKIGNPVLRAKTASLPLRRLATRSFKRFLKDMVTTMREAQGVGLAANQVGSGLRAFVMECKGNQRYPRVASVPLQTFLNARIVRYSKTLEKRWEGCLSIPGFRGVVPRSKEVTFEAVTPEGKRVRKTVHGFEARIVQHEVDHLNGFFYMDRMNDLKTWMHLEEFNKRFGKNIKDKTTDHHRGTKTRVKPK